MEFPRSPLIPQAIEAQRKAHTIESAGGDPLLKAIFPEWVEFINQNGALISKRNFGILSWETREVKAWVSTSQEPISATASWTRTRLLRKIFEEVDLRINGLPQHLFMVNGLKWSAYILGEETPSGVREEIKVRNPNMEDATSYTLLLADFRNALASNIIIPQN